MITFTKTGNSVKMDIASVDIIYLSPETSIFVKSNENKIYLQSTSNTFLTKSYISFLPTEVNGRPSDVLEDVADWLQSDYFTGLTLQATGDIDLGDVTVINGTGANAVNIRDGGNSITVDGAVQITDGVTGAEVVPLTGYNAQAVAIVDGSGNQITSFGGGTQYTEGDTDASITGTAMLWEDTSDTLRSVSAAKPLPVNIVAGSASGTEYTEGDVDASIAGTAMMMEVAGNILQPIQGTVADGLLVNLGANNDVTVSGIPELVVENAITATAYALGGASYSATSAISSDYILDHIQFNFSTAESRDVTVTLSDGTILWSATGDTSLDIVLEDIDKAFNANDNFTIDVTQTGGACAMDVLAVIKKGSAALAGNTSVTLYATNDDGNIKALASTAEGHLEVAIHSPRLPFGSLHTESIRPEFQCDSVYGINPREVISTTGHAVTPGAANSGAISGSNNLFKVSTGTTQYSFATIQSRKRLRYRAGQGIIGRFTALWSAPAASSISVAGFGTSESGFYFGYNGTSFGILHSTGNTREIQTLTVSTASTATNNYNIQLAGITTNVTATNNGSTVKTAYEISQGVYPGWKAEARGSTVVFLADSVGNKTGTFSLAQSGAGTPAAGSFAETLAGATTADTWIPQSSWNGDKLDGTGASGVILDVTKGNVFQILIQYLGFGGVSFQVEATNTQGNNPDFVTVHTIGIPNTRTSVSINQPSFPFTLAAYSAGSTTDISVSCASFAGFIEGEKRLTGPRKTFFVETNGYVGSAAATYYPLFTIRNDYIHGHNGTGEKANQSVVYPLSISCAHDDATPITFYLIRNATLNGTPNFSRYDAETCIYLDTSATTCSFSSSGLVQFAYTLGQNSGGAYQFEDELKIQPGETLTLAARAVTGTATYVNASMNTREDQ